MAFVRVKRRHDEDPFNSIVVSHKKLKPIGTDSIRNCVFEFTATLKDEHENLSQILQEVRKGKSVKLITKNNRNTNINSAIEHSKAERLKLVNTLRAVKQDTVPVSEEDGENFEIKVVDFVKQAENSSKSLIDEGISIDYVYDLYYASTVEDKVIDIQDIDSVHGLDSEKFYSICSNIDDSDESSQCEEDDDDSNDEANWRNDYPDEDEMDISDKDDFESLVVQSKRWNINSGSSSSSRNSSCAEVEDNSDDDNSVDDYGIQFARYKERVKAEEHCFYNNIIDDTPSESSVSDSY